MLGYIDALCAALLARNKMEIRRLLALPAAARLPKQVREEAMAIAQGRTHGFLAPVHALQYYYKLSHLLDESAELPDIEPAEEGEPQIDLGLRAVNG